MTSVRRARRKALPFVVRALACRARRAAGLPQQPQPMHLSRTLVTRNKRFDDTAVSRKRLFCSGQGCYFKPGKFTNPGSYSSQNKHTMRIFELEPQNWVLPGFL
ncbi:MAG: hypothetical protein EOM20_12345 [Spartobacteria bacterium]|nr:hypothetical protein [Spartobacteria bacterium]